MGELEVGVRPGTAAWLDVQPTSASVRNRLDADRRARRPRHRRDPRPHPVGDIVIRRA